jgi:hypothetical protein
MKCRAAVTAGLVLVSACASHQIPEALRGYDILVPARDEQSLELARAMRSSGYHVRTKLRGGNRPTAALIHFTFSEPGPGEPLWLHVRLADTRSGVIVGTAAIPLDSAHASVRARAQAAVEALSSP